MPTLPSTMLAIDPDDPGGAEVLVPVERPVPRPGAGDVLVRVEAAGVNRPDVLQREGKYAPPAGAPTVLGLEIAGTIVETGPDVPTGRMGERVCALVTGGGYAEYCVAPIGQCLPWPAALSAIEAAALPEGIFTVWHALFQRGGVQAGDAVLVHGGTSGIGTMAVLLGRLFQLTVIVTAGNGAKCDRALAIGAAHAIDYRAQDFVAEVQRLTDGAGVQAVLDMVGGDYLARNLRCLAEDGRHVSIATQRGVEATLPIGLMMRRRLTLTGFMLRGRSTSFKAALRDEIAARAWPFVEQGRLRPVIDRSFSLADAADAHRRLEAGQHVGKVVLRVG